MSVALFLQSGFGLALRLLVNIGLRVGLTVYSFSHSNIDVYDRSGDLWDVVAHW